MISAEQNDFITRVGRGTPAGTLLRRYWQPVALADELAGPRPVKAVQLMGQHFVLFRDENGQLGMLDRDCPHRGADLAFGRLEHGGLRCPFHGWLFDAKGNCLETPAEPVGSKLCTRIKQAAYPVVERAGIVFAYIGEGEPPAFPEFDCFVAPDCTPSPSRACSNATGCRRSRSASTRRMPRTCTASSRTRTPRRATASSSAAPRPTPTCRSPRCCASTTARRSASSRTDYGMRLTALRKLVGDPDPRARDQRGVPAGLRDPDERRDDDLAVARAGRRHALLLVCDLHQLHRPGRQAADARPAPEALRAARLHLAQEQAQQLRLQRRRAAERDLHRHGRRHQRARPVGDRVAGPDPGPHARAPGQHRQGHHRLPPDAGAGHREPRRPAKRRRC